MKEKIPTIITTIYTIVYIIFMICGTISISTGLLYDSNIIPTLFYISLMLGMITIVSLIKIHLNPPNMICPMILTGMNAVAITCKIIQLNTI